MPKKPQKKAAKPVSPQFAVEIWDIDWPTTIVSSRSTTRGCRKPYVLMQIPEHAREGRLKEWEDAIGKEAFDAAPRG
jgi:hypothetical protein